MIFPKEAVTIQGMLATYEFEKIGKRLRRYFCPVCGSAISITLDCFPGIRSMMGGTLDDKNKVKLTFSIWCSEGQPWRSYRKALRASQTIQKERSLDFLWSDEVARTEDPNDSARADHVLRMGNRQTSGAVCLSLMIPC